MSTDDTELRDILEEHERNSIRCALLSISASSASSKRRSRIDPYKREMAAWIRTGMPSADAVRLLRDKMGLTALPRDGALVCTLGGSGKYAEVHLELTSDNRVASVEFIQS